MNQIDRFFASRLTGYQIEPSNRIALEIDTIIKLGQRRKAWSRIGIAASISVLLILGSILVLNLNSTDPQTLASDVLSSEPVGLPSVQENTQKLTEASDQVLKSEDANAPSIVLSQIPINQFPSHEIALIKSKPGMAIPGLGPKAITINKHPFVQPAADAGPSSPSVAIIYKRSKPAAQAMVQAETEDPESRLQQWLTKAKGWREGELSFPNLGDVAGSLFAKDLKKSESKSNSE